MKRNRSRELVFLGVLARTQTTDSIREYESREYNNGAKVRVGKTTAADSGFLHLSLGL